jgi:hypothetical protein
VRSTQLAPGVRCGAGLRHMHAGRAPGDGGSPARLRGWSSRKALTQLPMFPRQLPALPGQPSALSNPAPSPPPAAFARRQLRDCPDNRLCCCLRREVVLECEVSRERVPLRNAYKHVGQAASVRVNSGAAAAVAPSAPPFPQALNTEALLRVRGDMVANEIKVAEPCSRQAWLLLACSPKRQQLPCGRPSHGGGRCRAAAPLHPAACASAYTALPSSLPLQTVKEELSVAAELPLYVREEQYPELYRLSQDDAVEVGPFTVSKGSCCLCAASRVCMCVQDATRLWPLLAHPSQPQERLESGCAGCLAAGRSLWTPPLPPPPKNTHTHPHPTPPHPSPVLRLRRAAACSCVARSPPSSATRPWCCSVRGRASRPPPR